MREGASMGWRTMVGKRQEANAPDPDAKWVSQARQGDVRACESLFLKYRATTFRLALRFVENADDAEEIVTDVFVRAFRSLSSFRGDCLFSTWLHRITVNAALNVKSRRPADTASLDDPTTHAAALVGNPQAMIEELERRRTVRRAVRELSPKLRAVVVLHYFEGWTCEQIADVLNISVGTVWSRLNAAKAKLAQRLRGELFD